MSSSELSAYSTLPRQRDGGLIKYKQLLGVLVSVLFVAPAWSGPILLTGHDPDFHAQSAGAEGPNTQLFLDSILDFVTSDTYDNGIDRFLWVESRPTSIPGGHRVGEAGLGTLGLSLGTHYDRANAGELASIDFTAYTAIVVASGFGGLLTAAELDGLTARSADIADFVNSGGGLAAFGQCFNCGANPLNGASSDLFGFVPLSGISTAAVSAPFSVTAAGAAAPFNLQNAWVNSPTHNSFTSTGGLSVLDTDSNGVAVTIAGNVNIDDGGFTPEPVPVPEPGILSLLGAGMLSMVVLRRRHSRLRSQELQGYSASAKPTT